MCGLIGMTIFTMHEEWNVKYNYDGTGQYFADYWWIEPTHSMVNGVFFNIEMWYRWSYGMGWAAGGFAIFTFIVSILSDLTRNLNAHRRDQYNDDELMITTIHVPN